MASTVQAGWHIDKDDDSIDNVSTGSTFNTKRNENLLKNDQDSRLYNNLKKKATYNSKSITTHTDEEGWTTARLGKKKPKKTNNKGSSTESIIMSIEGDIDMIDTRKQNRINVTSPGRKYKCNIPEDRKKEELNFNPTIMEAKGGEGGEGGKEQSKEGTTEGDKESSKEKEKEKRTDNNNNGENEREGDDGGGNKNNEEGREDGRRGRGGRKRGGSCCCSSFGRVRGTIAQPSMRSTVVQHGSLHRAIGFGTAVVAAEAEKKRGKNDQQRKRMNNNNNKRTNPDK